MAPLRGLGAEVPAPGLLPGAKRCLQLGGNTAAELIGPASLPRLPILQGSGIGALAPGLFSSLQPSSLLVGVTALPAALVSLCLCPTILQLRGAGAEQAPRLSLFWPA